MKDKQRAKREAGRAKQQQQQQAGTGNAGSRSSVLREEDESASLANADSDAVSGSASSNSVTSAGSTPGRIQQVTPKIALEAIRKHAAEGTDPPQWALRSLGMLNNPNDITNQVHQVNANAVNSRANAEPELVQSGAVPLRHDERASDTTPSNSVVYPGRLITMQPFKLLYQITLPE